jgi:nucleoside-diphosphate-sugar epimerase
VYRHSHATGDIARDPLIYSGVRHVFHLAARTFVPESWDAPRAFYETNVLGTANALEFCRYQRCSMTMVSAYVYGRPRRRPIAEDHPLEASSPYSHSKILAEEIARYYAAQYGVRVTIVRPFNVYGPGQNNRFLVPLLIEQALDPTCETIRVADLRPRRDFLHVSDLVALLLATLERRPDEVYNAGAGASVAIPELVDIINTHLPRPKPLESEQRARAHDAEDPIADISKAARELDWFPRVSLQMGIGEWIDSMKAGGAAR